MDVFREILLQVWREACRRIRISEAVTTMVRLLARSMPISGVVVQEFNIDRSCLNTVASGWLARDGLHIPVRTDLSAGQMKRLLALCRQGQTGRAAKESQSENGLSSLVPKGWQGDALVGPLVSERESRGILILLAGPEVRFEPIHEEMFRILLEPFSAALENDHRLRELSELRESAEADNRSLLAKLGRKELSSTIIGATTGLRHVMERVELIAKADVPVLILGETGSGKELIARAIHSGSMRSSGPFIRVNCGAMPPELIDSQLFGHERGSFTGATDQHKGWFERADGGTLLLDEIGDLPPAAQVRLLRVLQDGDLERVGGQEQIKVDIRLVAATHRDLSAMVREGQFREDLSYRIAVFPLYLPPLRERKEDIAELACHFAQKAATRFGLPPQLPQADDIAALTAYSWPGNVRELASVIDRAALLGNGNGLEVAKALGASATGAPSLQGRESSQAETQVEASPDTFLPLDAAMKQHIETALALAKGRIEGPNGAADLLRINPHTLRARMRKLDIDWRRFRSAGLS